MKRIMFGVVAMTFLVVCLAIPKETTGKNDQLRPLQIIENSQLAFYYQGDDMKADVVMELIDKGKPVAFT